MCSCISSQIKQSDSSRTIFTHVCIQQLLVLSGLENLSIRCPFLGEFCRAHASPPAGQPISISTAPYAFPGPTNSHVSQFPLYVITEDKIPTGDSSPCTEDKSLNNGPVGFQHKLPKVFRRKFPFLLHNKESFFSQFGREKARNETWLRALPLPPQ